MEGLHSSGYVRQLMISRGRYYPDTALCGQSRSGRETPSACQKRFRERVALAAASSSRNAQWPVSLSRCPVACFGLEKRHFNHPYDRRPRQIVKNPRPLGGNVVSADGALSPRADEATRQPQFVANVADG